jgi:hypothetical protein
MFAVKRWPAAWGVAPIDVEEEEAALPALSR